MFIMDNTLFLAKSTTHTTGTPIHQFASIHNLKTLYCYNTVYFQHGGRNCCTAVAAALAACLSG